MQLSAATSAAESVGRSRSFGVPAVFALAPQGGRTEPPSESTPVAAFGRRAGDSSKQVFQLPFEGGRLHGYLRRTSCLGQHRARSTVFNLASQKHALAHLAAYRMIIDVENMVTADVHAKPKLAVCIDTAKRISSVR